MRAIQEKTINNAVAMLNALQAQYKIILPDGTEFGTLEVKSKSIKKNKSRIRNPRVPHGTMTPLYKDKIDAAEIGDVIQIDVTNLPAGVNPKMLRSAVTAHATVKWGAGSYNSTLTNTNIEVLRIL